MTLNGAIMELVMLSEHPMMPVIFKPSTQKIIETVSECEESERKTGKWIEYESDTDKYDKIKCTNCGRRYTVDAYRWSDIGFTKEDLKFCPNCGCKMEG